MREINEIPRLSITRAAESANDYFLAFSCLKQEFVPPQQTWLL
jgi:hypothetical protein